MTKRLALAVDASTEIDRFGRFDHATRRFIAHALSLVPEDGLPPPGLTDPQNPPLPFRVSDAEAAERRAAYATLPELRAATLPGQAGHNQRRLLAGDFIALARVDIRWKRLPDLAAALFLYERLVGPAWRELIPLLLREAGLQRRKRGAAQLPLDRRLRADRNLTKGLDGDPPPVFFPSLADADAFGLPLLGQL